MKKLLTSVIFGAVLIGLAFAAAAPTFGLGPFYVSRLQTDPQVDASGNLTGCVVQIFYKQDLINLQTQAHVQQDGYQGTATIDAVKDAARTVTFQFNGQSYTMPYGLLVSGVAQAALDNAPATP